MNIRAISLLIALVTLTFAEESGNVLSDKGETLEFQEIGGKKNFATLDPEVLLKRAAMGFQGMRGKKNPMIADVGNELYPRETDKRAPMGFQGMRGKKNNLMVDFDDAYLFDDYEKRAPMGFQGMRGKKATLEDEHYKRAPMGFQGMRGKKSLEEILDDFKERTVGRYEDSKGKDMYLIDYPDYGKRILSMDGYQNILDRKDELLKEWEKRALMGFQGTRGKKLLDTLEEHDKRGVMGFHEMQGGKMDTLDNYMDYPLNPFDYEKRSVDFQDAEGAVGPFKRSRIGFHGMRGKRGAAEIYGSNSSTVRTPMGYQGTSNRGNSLAAYEIEKRAPYRYFGLRDKKNPRLEFRGKFVGVRGKKSSTLEVVGQRRNVL